MAVLAADFPAWVLITGALTGMTYGLMAIGLILIYRASGVINLAQGAMGGLGAFALVKLVVDLDWNYWVALVVCLLGGAVIGALVELGVVRRLFNAPRTILLVATIGITQIMLVLQLTIPSLGSNTRFPTPLARQTELFGFMFRGEHFMILIVVPAVVASLTWFLNKTPYGVAVRASAQNAEAAELAGISVRRVDTVVWAISGALATLTVVLVLPTRGAVGAGTVIQQLGPGLLLRALAAALVARMVSLPVAVLGGIVLGMGEAILLVNVDAGAVDLGLFILVLVLVMSRGRTGHSAAHGWSSLSRRHITGRDVQHVWFVRWSGRIAGVICALIAIALPFVFDQSSQVFLFSRVVLFAMLGIGVTILIGWAGELSLGQFAFFGLGAFVAASVFTAGGTFLTAVAVSVVVGIGGAVLVGLPAARSQSLFLVVTTLAFAVMAASWLFDQTWLRPENSPAALPRDYLFGLDLLPQRSYYFVCLGALLIAALALTRLGRSRRGRSIVAVRDNGKAAASLGVSPTIAKLAVFMLAGAVTALAGSLFAGLQVRFGPEAFPPEESLQLVALAVIGGLGSIPGAILGAVYVVGLPAIFGHNETIGLMTSGIGLLLLLMYFPGGLMQVADSARVGLEALARKWGMARPVPARLTEASGVSSIRVRPRPTGPSATDGPVAVRSVGVSVRFGGLQALHDVSIEVRRGEMVGLIGANGAGKSTLMDVISGYTRSTTGRIELHGIEVTRQSPQQRARQGLGRVFQDARLFDTLTVGEIVEVACEAHEHSRLLPSMFGTPGDRRRARHVRQMAAECIDMVGLGPFVDRTARELSTGTRRIVELACQLAQGSSVMLLDEPTGGLAQRETEAFGPLIRRVQAELGAAAIVIEHDMPLVMSIADRIYCLDLGEVIAHGSPDAVRHDPRVVAAYLGTNERSIVRSGATTRVPETPDERDTMPVEGDR